MRAYFDASALVAMLLKEPGSRSVSDWIVDFEGMIAVSDFAALEVASAISLRVRRLQDDTETGRRRLDEFDAWRSLMAEPVRLEPADFGMADLIVRRFDLNLRGPDALHAAACHRLDMRMMTLDQQLARACAGLDIPVADLPPIN